MIIQAGSPKWRREGKLQKKISFNEMTEIAKRNLSIRLQIWKSPVINKVHKPWYKKLTITHTLVAKNSTTVTLKQIGTLQINSLPPNHILNFNLAHYVEN